LCWDGVDLPASAESVDHRLAELGARQWQRDLCAAAIAEALDDVTADPPD
ncbi:ribonuclease D, partial [Streptomyces sp. SID10244]|nr:ribonuclease D [Streptomyces sp. SID10244]